MFFKNYFSRYKPQIVLYLWNMFCTIRKWMYLISRDSERGAVRSVKMFHKTLHKTLHSCLISFETCKTYVFFIIEWRIIIGIFGRPPILYLSHFSDIISTICYSELQFVSWICSCNPKGFVQINSGSNSNTWKMRNKKRQSYLKWIIKIIIALWIEDRNLTNYKKYILSTLYKKNANTIVNTKLKKVKQIEILFEKIWQP